MRHCAYERRPMLEGWSKSFALTTTPQPVRHSRPRERAQRAESVGNPCLDGSTAKAVQNASSPRAPSGRPHRNKGQAASPARHDNDRLTAGCKYEAWVPGTSALRSARAPARGRRRIRHCAYERRRTLSLQSLALTTTPQPARHSRPHERAQRAESVGNPCLDGSTAEAVQNTSSPRAPSGRPHRNKGQAASPARHDNDRLTGSCKSEAWGPGTCALRFARATARGRRWVRHCAYERRRTLVVTELCAHEDATTSPSFPTS